MRLSRNAKCAGRSVGLTIARLLCLLSTAQQRHLSDRAARGSVYPRKMACRTAVGDKHLVRFKAIGARLRGSRALPLNSGRRREHSATALDENLLRPSQSCGQFVEPAYRERFSSDSAMSRHFFATSRSLFLDKVIARPLGALFALSRLGAVLFCFVRHGHRPVRPRCL